MKKILIGLLLVVFTSVINVSAVNVIVTIPSAIDEEYICSSDYIVSSSVDWDKEGEGKVNYYDKEKRDYLTKDVFIKEIKSLEDGIHIVLYDEIAVDEAITVRKIVNINDKEFFLLGSVDAKTYPYESNLDKDFAYLAYYKDNTLQWAKIIRETRYGKLNDGVVLDNAIAVIGDYDSITQNSNVFILLVSFDGKVIYDKEIKGSLNDFSKNIYYKAGNLIFCGVSESKNYDFYPLTKSGYDIFVGNINLETKDLDIYLVGNNGDDLLLKSFNADGYLYIYTYLKGGGFYFNNYTYDQNFKCLIEVDERFEFNNFVAVPALNNQSNEDIFVFNNKIVISNFEYGSNSLSFRLYNKRLEFDAYKSYTIKTINSLIDYKIITKSDKLYLTTLAYKGEGNVYNTNHILDINYQENSYFDKKTLDMQSSILDYSIIDGKIKINVLNKNDATINVLDYVHLQVKHQRKEEDAYYLNDYDVYINGKLVEKKLAKDVAPSNAFGEFIEIYTATLFDYELVLPIEKYYYPKINLKNKEKYDLGVILSFNGKGYLNDEEITNNYKITEAGKYVLEIKGSNGERKVINFDVLDLSYNPDKKNDYIENEFIPYQEYDYLSSKVEINLNQFNIEQIDNYAIIIIFAFIAFGIILGIILPTKANFKFKWRKKDV